MARETSGRTTIALPHAPATEASVLASSLIDQRYWPLAESLDGDVASLFYEPDHHRIAAAMHRLYAAGRVVNEDAVADALRISGEDLEGGSREFLVEMSFRAAVRNQAEFRDQINALGEQRSLRRIATDAQQIAERARSGEETAARLAEDALGLAEHGRSTQEPIQRFGEYIDGFDSTMSYAIPTCLNAVDRLINGWEAGRIYALAARPKVGKTSVMLNAAVRALNADATVVMFSLEMSRRELWTRLLACTAFVPVKDIEAFLNKKKTLDDFPQDQREDLEQAIDGLRTASLYVQEAGEIRSGIHDVVATIVDVKARHNDGKPFIVFIDYLQLLVRDAKDSTSEISNITRELKLLATRLDIPIVLLSQINRDGAETESGMPSPHQMRGSGSIEQDADVTILLNRKFLQNSEHPDTDMDIWVALSRNSPTGWVKAFYSSAEQTVSDVEHGGRDSRVDNDGEELREPSRPQGSRRKSELDDALDDAGPDASVDFDAYADEFGL